MPLVIDNATTGFKSPDTIEIAYTYVSVKPQALLSKKSFKTKMEFYKAIYESIECNRYIHSPNIDLFKMPKHEYFVAHQAGHVWNVLNRPETKLICTKKLSMIAFANRDDIVKHNLVYLILKLFPADGMKLVENSHIAKNIVFLTVLLLGKIVEQFPHIQSWEEFHRLSLKTSDKKYKLTTMPFGKYKNMRFCDIPADYIEWSLKNLKDMNGSLKTCLTDELKSREF